jgi:dihydroxyacetone kinase phosphoprotein-dependent L subunit
MKVLNAHEINQMLGCICDTLIGKEQELCKLDSFIGDGDHGVTISRGFSAVKAKLDGMGETGIGNQLTQVGDTLSETMGGAIGPIIGGIFTAMGEAAAGVDALGTAKAAEMLHKGLEEVMMIGSAKPGDRTLVDALAPAVDSMESDAKTDIPLGIALEHAAAAAKLGAENTKNMIAKKGRAKFLQEKSLGYQDAGATSMSYIFLAMSQYCKEKD